MARLIVALACAAGVSAFLAPSAPVSAPKTVVFCKGGELRDRIQTVGNTQKITEAMRLVAATAHFHRLIDMTKKTATKKTTTPKAKTTKPTKATLKKGGGQEGEEGGRKGKCARDEEEGRWHFRAQGPFAGVGDHLRWEEDGAHGGYEEDLGLHQEKQPQSGPHDQAGFHPECHLPGGEHRHAQDGRLRQQAPVVSPWASPGDSAEEFRRRAGLSSR